MCKQASKQTRLAGRGGEGSRGGVSVWQSKGAFTPDANEAIRANDLHIKSMQRRDRQTAALFARMRRRELKNRNFDVYSHRVNQSGACSSSDVITSRGRKSETTMEDKLIVVVCGYPELYDITSYF